MRTRSRVGTGCGAAAKPRMCEKRPSDCGQKAVMRQGARVLAKRDEDHRSVLRLGRIFWLGNLLFGRSRFGHPRLSFLFRRGWAFCLHPNRDGQTFHTGWPWLFFAMHALRVGYRRRGGCRQSLLSRPAGDPLQKQFGHIFYRDAFASAGCAFQHALAEWASHGEYLCLPRSRQGSVGELRAYRLVRDSSLSPVLPLSRTGRRLLRNRMNFRPSGGQVPVHRC